MNLVGINRRYRVSVFHLKIPSVPLDQGLIHLTNYHEYKFTTGKEPLRVSYYSLFRKLTKFYNPLLAFVGDYERISFGRTGGKHGP